MENKNNIMSVSMLLAIKWLGDKFETKMNYRDE